MYNASNNSFIYLENEEKNNVISNDEKPDFLYKIFMTIYILLVLVMNLMKFFNKNLYSLFLHEINNFAMYIFVFILIIIYIIIFFCLFKNKKSNFLYLLYSFYFMMQLCASAEVVITKNILGLPFYILFVLLNINVFVIIKRIQNKNNNFLEDIFIFIGKNKHKTDPGDNLRHFINSDKKNNLNDSDFNNNFIDKKNINDYGFNNFNLINFS